MVLLDQASAGPPGADQPHREKRTEIKCHGEGHVTGEQRSKEQKPCPPVFAYPDPRHLVLFSVQL